MFSSIWPWVFPNHIWLPKLVLKAFPGPSAVSISLLGKFPRFFVCHKIFIKQHLPCQANWEPLGFVIWSSGKNGLYAKLTPSLSLFLSLSPGISIAVPGQECWHFGCFCLAGEPAYTYYSSWTLFVCSCFNFMFTHHRVCQHLDSIHTQVSPHHIHPRHKDKWSVYVEWDID